MVIPSFVRINGKIRVPKVRCVDENGEMVGVISTIEAIRLAKSKKLDLVEISPGAKPPVCRIMDYGKFQYNAKQKQKGAKKKQQNHAVKEIKFHANVEEHDFQTKIGHITKFLQKGHKVKVSLQFRGRENAHKELGFEIVNRVKDAVADISSVDSEPRMMGRMILMVLAPISSK
ncbi:MAG: translation initiation factor IF-3 [Kiritimatiellae bacterium]|jgi:translation initiation factor IF-3|nr:translation initiation factor IF-3 [Kiritimatiellia bacterium]